MDIMKNRAIKTMERFARIQEIAAKANPKNAAYHNRVAAAAKAKAAEIRKA